MAVVSFSPRRTLRRSRAVGALLVSLSLRAFTIVAAAADAPTLQIELGGGATLELVRLEPGTFVQGSPAGAPGRRDDETERTVTLTRPFYLGKYPVTRGQFARFVSETNSRTEAEVGTSGGFGWDGSKLVQRREFTWKNPGFPQLDSHPVTIVTHKDAKAFLSWLSRKSGRKFELPTEAQWEYACRAGTTTAYVNGDDPARAAGIGWSKDNSAQGTQPVGGKPLNAWGLGDMPGNVWQWCEDWYAPYTGDEVRDPLQTNSTLSDKPRRVLRGGSWTRPAADLRSAARYRNDPASRNCDNGFRVMTFDVATAQATPPPPPQTASSFPPLESTGRTETDRVNPDPSPSNHASDSYPAPSARPRASSFFGLAGIVIVLAFVAMIVAVVRALTKSGGISAQPGNMASTNFGPVRTRVVDDGFWIESATLPAGSVVVCRYAVSGRKEQKDVTFQGGSKGQFVFTGSRPENVSIVVEPAGSDITGSDMGRIGGLASSILPPSSPFPPPVPDRPRTQTRLHPPAY